MNAVVKVEETGESGVPVVSEEIDSTATETANVFETLAGSFIEEELLESGGNSEPSKKATPEIVLEEILEDPIIDPGTQIKKTPDELEEVVTTQVVKPPILPKAKTSEQLQTEYETWRTEAENKLATDFYKISEAEIEEYQVRPEVALPKLLARVHMSVQDATLKAMQSLLPQILESHQTTTTQEKVAEDLFFGLFPALKGRRGEVEADAITLAGQFRARDPNITQDKLMRQVGATLHVMHQIPMPGNKAGDVMQVLPPARPAFGSAGKTVNPQGAKEGTWEENLYQDFLNNED